MIDPSQFVPRGTIFRDETEKTSLEERNGVIQARFVLATIINWAEGTLLSPEILLEFQ